MRDYVLRMLCLYIAFVAIGVTLEFAVNRTFALIIVIALAIPSVFYIKSLKS